MYHTYLTEFLNLQQQQLLVDDTTLSQFGLHIYSLYRQLLRYFAQIIVQQNKNLKEITMVKLPQCYSCTKKLYTTDSLYGCLCCPLQTHCFSCNQKKAFCGHCNQPRQKFTERCRLCYAYQPREILLNVKSARTLPNNFCYDCVLEKYNQRRNEFDIKLDFITIGKKDIQNFLRQFCSNCHGVLSTNHRHLNYMALKSILCSRCNSNHGFQVPNRRLDEVSKQEKFSSIYKQEQHVKKSYLHEKQYPVCVACGNRIYLEGKQIEGGGKICRLCVSGSAIEERHNRQKNQLQEEKSSILKYQNCSSCDIPTIRFREVSEGCYLCLNCYRVQQQYLNKNEEMIMAKSYQESQRKRSERSERQQSLEDDKNQPQIYEQQQEQRPVGHDQQPELIIEPISQRYQLSQEEIISKEIREMDKKIEDIEQEYSPIKAQSLYYQKVDHLSEKQSTNLDQSHQLHGPDHSPMKENPSEFVEIIEPQLGPIKIQKSDQKIQNEDPLILNIPIEIPQLHSQDLVYCIQCQLQIQVAHSFWHEDDSMDEAQSKQMPTYCFSCFSQVLSPFIKYLKKTKERKYIKEHSKAMKPMENVIDKENHSSSSKSANSSALKNSGLKEALGSKIEQVRPSRKIDDFRSSFIPESHVAHKQNTYQQSSSSISRNLGLQKSNIYDNLNVKQLPHKTEILKGNDKPQERYNHQDEWQKQRKTEKKVSSKQVEEWSHSRTTHKMQSSYQREESQKSGIQKYRKNRAQEKNGSPLCPICHQPFFTSKYFLNGENICIECFVGNNKIKNKVNQ